MAQWPHTLRLREWWLRGGGEGKELELLSMCEEWRMPNAAGSFPLRAALAVAAVAAPPPAHTLEVAGLDERPQ